MGQKMSLKEQLRANKRMINRAIREIDRERNTLEREQAKLTKDIKKMAKQNQMSAVRIMAKDLVRNKRFCTKMLEMRSQLWGVQQRMAEMKSTQAMTSAMQNAAQVSYDQRKASGFKPVATSDRETLAALQDKIDGARSETATSGQQPARGG